MLALNVDPGEPLVFSRKGVPIGTVKVVKRSGRSARMRFAGFDGIDIYRQSAKDQTPAEWDTEWPDGNGNRVLRREGLGVLVTGPHGSLAVAAHANGLALSLCSTVVLTPEQLLALAEMAAELKQ